MNILIVDRELDKERGPNFDELAFRLALEELGQNVITVHCKANNPPVLRELIGGRKVLAYEGCEVNASQFARENKKNAELLQELLQQRMENPKPGLKVELRDDGDFYVVYPPVQLNLANCQGVACLASTIGIEPAGDKALEILGECEDAGAVPLNSRESIEISKSKISSHHAFEEAGVPVPRTVCIPREAGFDEERIRKALREIGNPPYVVKGEHGFQGKRVELCGSVEEALCMAGKLMLDEHGAVHDGLVIQENIPPPRPLKENERWRGSERVMVVDGEVVGTTGKFLGKDVAALSDARKQVAIKAASAAKQFMGGVDLAGTEDNPLVLETNEAGSFLPWLGREDVVGITAQKFLNRIREIQRSTQTGFRARA